MWPKTFLGKSINRCLSAWEGILWELIKSDLGLKFHSLESSTTLIFDWSDNSSELLRWTQLLSLISAAADREFLNCIVYLLHFLHLPTSFILIEPWTLSFKCFTMLRHVFPFSSVLYPMTKIFSRCFVLESSSLFQCVKSSPISYIS